MSRVLAGKDWTKIYFQDGQKYRIQVRAVLQQLGGNPKPHFAITADIYRLARNGRKVCEAGGMLHDEIAEHFPHLQPLIDIHLSDSDGIPMHAYSNAGYWAGNTEYQPLNLKMLSQHLRVSSELAQEMVEYIEDFYGEFDHITTPEDAWQDTCEHFELLNKWKKEADQALAMLNPIFSEVTR